ncbi:MAG TPA: glycosyltransferase family 2 protein [Bacteroidales bacterium]|nr:glycosyltransferase family 2 protein [Bacteroidales bacterium]
MDTADDQLKWPVVSLVTVNYNQSAVTCQLLESLRACTYPALEVIVVDNGSPTDNPDIIAEKFPSVILIKTGKNLGFAGGNNAALPYATGKYLLFINNDTEVEPNFLQPMVELLENDQSIGMVSPRIQFFHTPGVLQYAGFTPFSKVTARNFAIGFGEHDNGQYCDVRETGSIFGAAMLVPRRVLNEVGPMDEIYFLYYEEHDWAARIKNAGYKIYFDGRSLVLHKESISTVKESPFQIYYMHRGRILFVRRNTKGFTKMLSLLYHYTIVLFINTLRFLLKGRADLAKAFLRGMYWNLVNPSR